MVEDKEPAIRHADKRVQILHGTESNTDAGIGTIDKYSAVK
jgi:hypothetical protein